MKNYIITTALPYANGNLHIGHFFEAILADIKVRHLKSKNIPCIFISGDDSHGAATTLYCAKNNLNIEEHLQSQHLAHAQAYKNLKIEFDRFSQTNTELHAQVVKWCVEKLIEFEEKNNKQLFLTKDVLSWYDGLTEQFLPDRYVVGTCPHCQAQEQHPEICEACDKRIAPPTLINPINNLSKNNVELKSSKHLLLNTRGFYEEISNYEHLFHPTIKNKIFDGSLSHQEEIDISRDGPYYGIKIDNPKFKDLDNQYYYVWFDAPIGYLSFSFQLWLKDRSPSKALFEEYCSSIELEHFIGKDIAYFHSFLWINILKIIVDKDKAPIKQLNFHGWITINYEKLSKRKGHAFDLDKLTSIQIDSLRLYLFTRHDGSILDTELIEADIIKTYNNTIVQNLANFYARLIRLLNKNEIKVDLKLSDKDLLKYEQNLLNTNYKKLYENLYEDLKELNSEFQKAELWKADSETLANIGSELLNRWYNIYHIFTLVLPSLEADRENILNNEFIHLAKNLEIFTLFKSE
jgi:methionyl-tRNA synthetase